MESSSDVMLSKETLIKALDAASLVAIEKARQTNTKLVIWRDEKIVYLTAEEALAEIAAQKKE